MIVVCLLLFAVGCGGKIQADETQVFDEGVGGSIPKEEVDLEPEAPEAPEHSKYLDPPYWPYYNEVRPENAGHNYPGFYGNAYGFWLYGTYEVTFSVPEDREPYCVTMLNYDEHELKTGDVLTDVRLAIWDCTFSVVFTEVVQ